MQESKLFLVFEFLNMDLKKYVDSFEQGKYLDKKLVKSYCYQVSFVMVLICSHIPVCLFNLGEIYPSSVRNLISHSLTFDGQMSKISLLDTGICISFESRLSVSVQNVTGLRAGDKRCSAPVANKFYQGDGTVSVAFCVYMQCKDVRCIYTVPVYILFMVQYIYM